MKIAIILTSHDELGTTGKKTGFWLEEFAAPYYVFKDAGVSLTLASPKGGQPPLDPVCHAPGVLRHVTAPDGTLLVKGKAVTGFTNTEEAAVQLTDVVPFLVEDMLTQAGGTYSKVADWQPYVVTAGHLITGQNPASSEPAAKELLKQLGK
jgi:putative intracellular protease/amidase